MEYKRNISPDSVHTEECQKLGVNHWETYNLVVNGISVRSLLYIASIHKFTSRSIEFVLDFPQAGLNVDVFMDNNLEMGFD